jgi:hypothetical protein
MISVSEEVEGTENITRVSVKDDVLIDGMPVWRVEEAVPIINSRIIIFVKQFGCYIDVPVVQQKGQGAYYVRGWTKLNKGCLELITWWIEQGRDFYEDYHIAENILNFEDLDCFIRLKIKKTYSNWIGLEQKI